MVFCLYQNITKAIVLPEKSYISVLEQLVYLCVCESEGKKSYLLLQLSDTMSKERTMKSESIHGKGKRSPLLQPHRYNQPLENMPVFQMSLTCKQYIYLRLCPKEERSIPPSSFRFGTQHIQKSTDGHLAGVVGTLLYLFLVFISDKCFTSC